MAQSVIVIVVAGKTRRLRRDLAESRADLQAAFVTVDLRG
jgi:hypothetical protein